MVLEVLMRYGNKYQEDKRLQQNSLFGDLGGGLGIEIAKPELPQVPRMSSIERLNIEKSLIGIFLSAHPLDEYEFEVTQLCNITSQGLTDLETLRTPDGRRAAAATDDSEETLNSKTTLNSTLSTLNLQPEGIQGLRLGGIVTSAEKLVSKNGNPYGRYVIEDYAGSYKLTLFGETYKQWAPMLEPNLYVLVSGNFQQKGVGQKWYKPKPIDQAEYEFVVQKVDLLKDAQKNYVESLTLTIPVEQVQPDLIAELTEQCQQHKGNIRLKIQVYDELKKNVITFTSQSYAVQVDSSFYHWLKLQIQDGTLTIKVD